MGIKVLSLFDGMSCGQIALDQLGVEVDTYYASEIDKWAMQITQKNYPNTIQVGDVCDLDPKDFQDVDLIMGGSPCQGFSFAGKQLAFDDPRSALFFQFVRLLEGIKPKYFLLENVKMKKEYLQVITDLLGVEPIFINSALVSAQSRQRYYWTNIPNIEQPEDRGIVLKDILEDDFQADKDKSYCIDANYHKSGSPEYLQRTYKTKAKRQAVFKPKQVGIATDINGHDILKRVYSPEGKSPCLNAGGGGNREPKVIRGGAIRGRYTDNGIKQMLELRKDDKSNSITTVQKDSGIVEGLAWRKLTPLECERLQTVPDFFTEGVSNTQRYKMLGNGWTVEVIKHILGYM
jgi:DNA-cytosine methyltransferase